jgi:hypothetical protein
MTTNNTVVTSSPVDSLIGGYRVHVLGRCLPTPATIQFHVRNPEVSIQPDGGLDTPRHLANLLVWAYTLTEVTAEWAHTDSGRLHINVYGRTNGGVRVNVYGGCDFRECLGLVALEQGQSEGVSLDELYTFVGLLREAQPQRGAA